MLGTRLATTDRYLLRPRLLDGLPDASGYVVCLEAPYGYGKSVLAMQWAQRLAGEGWRVAWTAPAGRGVREALARALDVPTAAPWGVVLEAAWATPTLVVLEDLEADEDLDPLLRHVDGLLALASRSPLRSPELPRWTTRGRLVRVTAAELAFRTDEAAALFDRPQHAEGAWRRTGGWPLPLHFAALTGEVPETEALAEGIRGSVAPDAWAEALLIATLDVLPEADATDATRALAAAGFVQTLAAGYRLHPLIGEAALSRHPEEARAAVAALAGRLPPRLRGEAYLRADHPEGLRALLEEPEGETYRAHPERFLAWHAAAGDPVGPARRCHVAVARMLAGDVDGGVAEAERLVDDADVADRWRVRAAVAALFALAQSGRVAEAERYANVADAHAADLPAFDRARVAQTRMILAHHTGRAADADRHLTEARRALTDAAADPRHAEARAILARNVASMRWSAHGEAAPQRAALRAVLDDAAAAKGGGRATGLTAVTLGGLVGMLATLEALAGDRASVQALARAWGPDLPGPDGFVLELVRARSEGDLEALARVHAEARRWELGDLADSAAACALMLARERGEAPPAFATHSTPGSAARFERAVATAAAGDAASARADLGDDPPPERALRLGWSAAAFQVTGDPVHLDALRAATDLGYAPLPYLGVPLDALPRDRPEAADAYPLDAVLASGWGEAIARREAEVPDLDVRLLGRVEARVLGRVVELSERQREALALLALGHGREAIGASLWPELDAAKVRNNLNVLLSGLRRSLQPWGLPTYLGDAGLGRTRRDLDVVEAALDAGDAAALAAAYAGRLGEGLDLPLLDEAAADLEARALALLSDVASTADPAAALPLHEARLAIDPWDPDAIVALVDALRRLGRHGAARRRVEAWAERWRREMELPVPQEVAALGA